MKTKATVLAVAAAAASLVAVGANAAQFNVLSSSTMNDVRNIGGQSIPNLADYQGFGGTLDITDPTTWELMDSDYSTMPHEAVELNSINVSGTLSTGATGVTSATLTQLGGLSFGLFQTEDTRSNLVTGAVGETIPTYAGRFNNPAGGQEYTALTWTYDAATNTMGHDAATTNSGCVAVVGANPTGSCGLYRNGITGATASSIWNWDGLVDGYTASNSRGVAAFPWGGDPASCDNGDCNAYEHVVIAQAGGTAGVTWDLSGLANCVSAGDICTITARVVASGMGDLPNGGNNTAITALYTLDLQQVPVPGALWLLGGALGGLGMIRRRQKAAA